MDDYYPFGMVTNHLQRQTSPLRQPVQNKGNNYLYNGKELQEDHRLDWYDYGARMYDGVLGRWWVVDPLADHPRQIGMSHYSAFWNNPVRYNDPDGRCPECEENIKDPTDGQSYTSTGGAEYTYGNGEWTRQGEILDEVTITASRSDGGELTDFSNSNLALTLGGAIYGA